MLRYPRANEVQLFDLKNDPWEINDLAEDEQYAQVLTALDGALMQLRKEMNDPLRKP